MKDGAKVKIEYTGTFEDGTVFDSSVGKDSLEFEIGANMIIPGLEKEVSKMKKGEEKEVTIKSEDAYGQPNPEMIKKVPREQLPPTQEPKVGMFLALQTPDGQQIPVEITEVTDKEVTIDLNHPLAGKTLKFKVKVLEVT